MVTTLLKSFGRIGRTGQHGGMVVDLFGEGREARLGIERFDVKEFCYVLRNPKAPKAIVVDEWEKVKSFGKKEMVG